MNISKLNTNAIDNKYLREAFVPLGLFGFAITTILLSLYNMGAFGSHNQELTRTWAIIFLSMCALFLGGFMQIVAGVITIRYGHIKTGSIFCSFGAFWLIWGTFNLLFYLSPLAGTNIAVLTDDVLPNQHSIKDLIIGAFLLLYCVICLMSFYISLYRNKITSVIFLVLVFAFLFLGIADVIKGSYGAANTTANGFQVAGGVFGFFAGIGAFYLA